VRRGGPEKPGKNSKEDRAKKSNGKKEKNKVQKGVVDNMVSINNDG